MTPWLLLVGTLVSAYATYDALRWRAGIDRLPFSVIGSLWKSGLSASSLAEQSRARQGYSYAMTKLCVILTATTVGCAVATVRAFSQQAAEPHFATDSWIGLWKGPEATYLAIAGYKGAYQITVQDLDRARTFDGTAVGDHIEFERHGTKETLKATNGDDTGMKWLAGKKDCLTIKPGEGFCRD